jgi:hypothetical protein
MRRNEDMKNSRIMAYRRMVMGVLVLGLAVIAGAAETEPWVRFSVDAQKIVVEAEGITRFTAVSSAVFDAGAETQRVGISGYKIIGTVRQSEGTPTFGGAVISEVPFGRDGAPFRCTLTLKRLKNLLAFISPGQVARKPPPNPGNPMFGTVEKWVQMAH